MWSLQFFESDRGESIIETYITTLQPKTQAKIIHLLDLLQEYGSAVHQMPYVRRISPQLSELRVRGREEVRLFFKIRKLTIYILHGFTKKTQKIPAKELKIASNRLEKI